MPHVSLEVHVDICDLNIEDMGEGECQELMDELEKNMGATAMIQRVVNSYNGIDWCEIIEDAPRGEIDDLVDSLQRAGEYGESDSHDSADVDYWELGSGTCQHDLEKFVLSAFKFLTPNRRTSALRAINNFYDMEG